METAKILTIIFFAALVQGSTGFGYALVSLGLLGLFLDISTASVIINLSGILLTIGLFYKLRSHFTWKRIIPCMVCIAIGTPIGVYLLVNADKNVLRIILGIFMICAGIYSFIPDLGVKRWHPVYLGIPCGLASGILGGALNAGGPPLVAYVASQNYTRFMYAAVLQACFLVYGIIRIPFLCKSGMITHRILILGLLGTGVTLIGGFIGLYILSKMPDKIFKKVIMGFIILLGIKYLFS